MAFEPQNDLERSLVKAATDAAHRPQFYKDLLASDVFVVQHGKQPPNRPAKVTLTEGMTLQIQNVEVDGKLCIPIFSSLLRLQATINADVAYLALNALELMRITRAPLLLNPGAEYGKELTAAEVASLVDGTAWQPDARQKVEKEVQVLLGKPSKEPTELLDALTRLFKTKKQVKRAWLAHYFNPTDGLPAHSLIGLEVTGELEAVMGEAGVIVRSLQIPNPPVDFMAVTGSGDFDDYFLKQTKPFYERKFLGLFLSCAE